MSLDMTVHHLAPDPKNSGRLIVTKRVPYKILIKGDEKFFLQKGQIMYPDGKAIPDNHGDMEWIKEQIEKMTEEGKKMYGFSDEPDVTSLHVTKDEIEMIKAARASVTKSRGRPKKETLDKGYDVLEEPSDGDSKSSP